LATSPAESPAQPGPARPGPTPDNVLPLPSATAQNVTGKQNRTGSYTLLADGAMSVSRSLTSVGFWDGAGCHCQNRRMIWIKRTANIDCTSPFHPNVRHAIVLQLCYSSSPAHLSRLALTKLFKVRQVTFRASPSTRYVRSALFSIDAF
jgi:hypothetical protein